MVSSSPCRLFTVLLGLPVFPLVFAHLGWAQGNTLAVRDTSASPGDVDVKIPIHLTVDQELTLFRADITFPVGLCDAIEDRNLDLAITGVVVGSNADVADEHDIVVRRTTRVNKNLQEQDFECNGGSVVTIPIAVLDILGEDIVIPAGDGAIVSIEFDVKTDATEGTFPFSPANIQANKRSLPVSVDGQAGNFTILDSCGDGIVDAGEECDDGNNEDGDGCSAECRLEPPDNFLHFLGYKIKESRGNICAAQAALNAGGACTTEEECGGDSQTELCVKNKFPKGVQVSLKDQFDGELDTGYFDVVKPVSLYTPANKNDEDPTAPAEPIHLKGYQIKEAKVCSDTKEPCQNNRECTDGAVCRVVKHEPQSNLRVENQFGTLLVNTNKVDRLLVPTAQDLAEPIAPPDPAAHTVDHYKCYTLSVPKVCEQDRQTTCQNTRQCGALGRCIPAFPKGLRAFVEDQFNQPALYDIQKPLRLCNPADKNEEGIKNAAGHLMCYQVKRAAKACTANAPANAHMACRREADCGSENNRPTFCLRQEQHQKREGIHVNNQFFPELLDTIKDEELCVPSTKMELNP